MDSQAFKRILEERSARSWEMYLPHLSVDCVVFGFHNASLKVLLTKLKDSELWGLPGGYVLKTENIHSAASRILFERTGASDIYLQQFRVFGDINRSEDFFKDFAHSSFEEKISKLRQIFRTNFRTNCEIGYYPPEYFLPQELFESLDNDSEFRTALLEVLRLEESATNEPASVVFDNLIKHYVCCKEA